MPELFVATNQAESDQALAKLRSARIPGFQISPEVELGEALGWLEAGMQDIYPGFGFRGAVNSESTNTSESWHLDVEAVKRLAGIALHHNVGGEGYVQLRLAFPGIINCSQGSNSLTNIKLMGRTHNGSLTGGTKTVFSEGIRTSRWRSNVGGTVHNFVCDPGTSYRAWTRYLNRQ